MRTTVVKVKARRRLARADGGGQGQGQRQVARPRAVVARGRRRDDDERRGLRVAGRQTTPNDRGSRRSRGRRCTRATTSRRRRTALAQEGAHRRRRQLGLRHCVRPVLRRGRRRCRHSAASRRARRAVLGQRRRWLSSDHVGLKVGGPNAHHPRPARRLRVRNVRHRRTPASSSGSAATPSTSHAALGATAGFSDGLATTSAGTIHFELALNGLFVGADPARLADLPPRSAVRRARATFSSSARRRSSPPRAPPSPTARPSSRRNRLRDGGILRAILRAHRRATDDAVRLRYVVDAVPRARRPVALLLWKFVAHPKHKGLFFIGYHQCPCSNWAICRVQARVAAKSAAPRAPRGEGDAAADG